MKMIDNQWIGISTLEMVLIRLAVRISTGAKGCLAGHLLGRLFV
jgi:hypothetical protein